MAKVKSVSRPMVSSYSGGLRSVDVEIECTANEVTSPATARMALSAAEKVLGQCTEDSAGTSMTTSGLYVREFTFVEKVAPGGRTMSAAERLDRTILKRLAKP